MSADLDRRLVEWAVWYHEHKKDAVDIDKRLEFLTMAVDGVFELIAMACKDLQSVEHRPGTNFDKPRIAIPRGVMLR